MKIIYPESGGTGVHMPYEFNTIKTKADFDRNRQVWEVDENGNRTLVGLDNCYIEWEPEDINYIAGLKIKSVYPEYKQLNILRTGNQEEIDNMNTFIEAVRAWANSENPDPWDKTLDQITV
jgi:hypothetical protein